MKPLILVLNSGSSSIKFQLFEGVKEQSLLSGLIENIGTDRSCLSFSIANGEAQKEDLPKINYPLALNKILTLYQKVKPQGSELQVIGHRVVHGGDLFNQPTLIDNTVIEQIKACFLLAPLHNPANLEGILAAQIAFPGVPQVAVFDTAFHQTMPDYAYLYAIPYHYYQAYKIRRYGFHGISYQYLITQAEKILNKPLTELALICAHLGNGCSITAILHGKSVDTSMGFTPLEGVMMGTRSGDIDPGLFGYLSTQLELTIDQIIHMLNTQSGLLGISQQTMDMRELQVTAAGGDLQAKLAIEMFCYRIAKYIASLFVPLGRLDALVFSGGIGENAILIREKILILLGFLGFTLDITHNATNGVHNQGRITTNEGQCALVIHTQEELMIAKQAMALIAKLSSNKDG